MAFDSNSRVFLAKRETTPYTDAAPVVGTDDLCVMSDSTGITTTITYGETMLASPAGGEMVSGINTKDATWSLNIPLYGRGLASGVIKQPRYVSAILGTFCDLTVGSSDSTSLAITPNLYAPVTVDESDTSTANARTFTLYEYAGRDGSLASGTKTLRIGLGCRVATATWTFPSQGQCILQLSGPCLAVEDADVTTDLSAFANDGVSVDWVYGGNMQATIDNMAGDGPYPLLNQDLTVTMNTGAAAFAGDSLGTGYSGTTIDNLTVDVAYSAVLSKQSDYDMWAQVWAGTPEVIATNSAGVFPAVRATDTGYGFKIDLPAVQGGATVTRDSPMRLSRSGRAKRASVSGSPVTITIF